MLLIGVTDRMNPSANGSVEANFSSENSELDFEALLLINKQKAALLVPAIIYAAMLLVIGVIGNPIAIYIYGWKWQSTTTRVFLFWLAIIDLINCIITMPTEIYVMTNFYYFPNAGFCRMSRFITYVINNTSAAVFIVIAIDRYIRICHPHRQTISVCGAQVACFLSSFIGFGVSWPALVLYGSKKIRVPSSSNQKGYIYGVICDVKNDMDNTPFPLAFFIYLWCAFCVCILILSALYILIGRVMLKRNRKKTTKFRLEASQFEHNGDDRNQHNDQTTDLTTTLEEPSSGNIKCSTNFHCSGASWKNSRMRPPRSTLMLFAITAVFVMSFLPFLIIMTVRQHIGSYFYPSLTPWEQVLVNLFSRSYLVNNCANPIVYGMCNSQFRNQVKKLFHISTKGRESSISREESRVSRGFSC
ncbi:unnamed protein product [Candidula unifasciata]|uniref:G-protein coupled receptors family 1 profile domain-containing protein n=1 Tax=Candidula unifasciata TaxID=100452 RepID=A0A8S3YKS6_9EUPU|nr:unnamed protein product [Candidula unifasciata]